MNEHPVDPTQQDSDADPVERSTVDESLDYDLDTLEQDDTVIGTALRKSLAVFGIVAILVTATVLLQGYLAEDDVEVTERAPLEVPQV
ncbi:MAG: hypothetical protein VX877_10365, partial [Planctomycetota bacterium]|nr:hypothetical protein [Planctomycetota bacterium]